MSSKLPNWPLVLVVVVLGSALLGRPGVTSEVPGYHFALGGLSALGAARLIWQRTAAVKPRISLIALFLTVIAALSSLVSSSVFITSNALASVLGFCSLVVILEFGLNSRVLWERTAEAMVAMATFSAAYGLYQWGGSLTPGQALSANFTNPDCYSAFLGPNLFLALALAIQSHRRTILYILAAVILGTSLILTGSRAGFLGLALGYLSFLFVLSSSRSTRYQKLAGKLFIIPVVALLMILVSESQILVGERMGRFLRGDDPIAIKSRWDALYYGLKCAFKKPLTGYGIGCFALAYQQFRPPLQPGEVYMNVAHNDYIQWLVETGAPGLGLWCLLIAYSIFSAWRSYRSPTPWVAGQVAGLLFLASYMTLNFSCPVHTNLLWSAAAFGLTAGLRHEQKRLEDYQFSPKYFPPALIFALAGIWAVHWGLLTGSTQEALKKAQQKEYGLDWEGAIQQLQPALRRQSSNYKAQLYQAELAKKVFVLTGDLKWLNLQEESILVAYQAAPSDPQVLLTVILFYQEQLRPRAAQTYLSQAQELIPYSVEVRRAVARNQILLGQLEQATQSLASLEQTGQPADEAALADLIYLLESKGSGRGLSILRKIGTGQPERAADLALASTAVAQRYKKYDTAEAILKQATYGAGKRADLMWELARNRGLAGNPEQELRLLGKLRQDKELETNPELQQRVWQQWAALASQKGQLELVAAQLEDYLISHQRENWARISLSETYAKRGLKSEARQALRSGLPYDTDGSLHVSLADLCLSQGLPELARGYYREALPLTRNPAAVEDKLRALKVTPEDPELQELEKKGSQGDPPP